MCMLDWVGRHFNTWQLQRVVVASVHHGMRGAEADADLELVRQQAERWNFHFIPVYLEAATLLGSGGFEARARDARYEALAQIRTLEHLDLICTAHHQADQVETLLLRMLRGTGLLGLRGIHAERADGVLRPMLTWTGNDFCQYVQEYQVSFREDATNRHMKYRRNFVRHALLPHLRANGSGVDDQLLRISKYSKLMLERLQLEPQSSLEKHPELLRLWRGMHGLKPPIIHENRPIPVNRGSVVDMVGQEGSLVWGGNMYLLSWQFRDRKGLHFPPPQGAEVWMDADHLPQSLQVRTRRDGDRFSPPGLRSMHRKLKKFFQEQGIPRIDRDGIPLVAVGDEVLWIPGFAVSGRYQVHEKTKIVLALRLTNGTGKSPEGLAS